MIEVLSPQAASRLLETVRLAAERLGVQVAVAVVDGGGNLAAFLRIGRAFLASSDLAIDKAWTAASFGMSTRAFAELLDGEPVHVRDGLARRPRVTLVPGGVPIVSDGRLIGALGVSGGSDIEDENIAVEALAALRRDGKGE